MTLNSSSKVIEPLRDLLGDVLLRLEALEGRVGLSSASGTATTNNNNSTATHHSLSSSSSHTKGTAHFLFHCDVVSLHVCMRMKTAAILSSLLFSLFDHPSPTNTHMHTLKHTFPTNNSIHIQRRITRIRQRLRHLRQNMCRTLRDDVSRANARFEIDCGRDLDRVGYGNPHHDCLSVPLQAATGGTQTSTRVRQIVTATHTIDHRGGTRNTESKKD